MLSNKLVTTTIADSATESGVIDKRGYASGLLHIPAGLEGTSFTFKVSDAADGTFTALKDATGNAVSIIGLGSSADIRPLPSELAAVRYFKIVADTAQSGALALKINLQESGSASTGGGVTGRRSDAYSAILTVADATSVQTVKAAVSGKSIYITDISISVDTAGWVLLQDDTGTPNTIIAKKYLPANSVWTKSYITPKKVASGKLVNVLAQNAGNITVDMDGYVV